MVIIDHYFWLEKFYMVEYCKEVPKQLLFLNLAQRRLSLNEAYDLKNMMHAKKNYFGAFFSGAQTIFWRWPTDQKIFFANQFKWI